MARMMKKANAFTLIEMAVIVIIVGVLLATFLPRMLSSIKGDAVKDSRNYLRQARDEIIGYAYMHGNLPADLLKITHRTDVWGQPFVYIVARDATGGALGDYLTGAGANVNNMDNTNLSVQKGTGGSSEPDIAFIIMSKGADLTEQYGESGAGTLSHVVTIYSHGFSDPGDPNPLVQNDPYDDMVEYVTLEYLKTKAEEAAGQTPAPQGSDVSFSSDLADFDKSGVTDPYGQAQGTVTINADGTVSLGGGTIPTSRGCLWYQGDNAAGNCVNGVCNLNFGLRVFFRFKFNDVDNSVGSGDYRAGFTFAVIDGDNDPNVCGRLGHTIGYACESSVPADCILPEKMAVEVDSYPNAFANDGATNHIAFLYWDNSASNDRYDDVNHTNFTGACPGDPCNRGSQNPENPNVCPQNVDAFHQGPAGTPNWLEDAVEHTMRIEIYRNATDGGPCDGVFNSTVWLDCDGDCSDLSAPYAGTADVVLQHNNTVANNGTLPSVRFGWTEGTGTGASQDITISDFGLKFLNDTPTHKY